jgi:hypothetical protein
MRLAVCGSRSNEPATGSVAAGVTRCHETGITRRMGRFVPHSGLLTAKNTKSAKTTSGSPIPRLSLSALRSLWQMLRLINRKEHKERKDHERQPNPAAFFELFMVQDGPWEGRVFADSGPDGRSPRSVRAVNLHAGSFLAADGRQDDFTSQTGQ